MKRCLLLLLLLLPRVAPAQVDPAPAAQFVRQYADAAALIRGAVEHYREDVERRSFPTDAESYHLSAAVRDATEVAVAISERSA